MGKKRLLFIHDGAGGSGERGEHAIPCDSCGKWQHRKCICKTSIFICDRDKL